MTIRQAIYVKFPLPSSFKLYFNAPRHLIHPFHPGGFELARMEPVSGASKVARIRERPAKDKLPYSQVTTKYLVKRQGSNGSRKGSNYFSYLKHMTLNGLNIQPRASTSRSTTTKKHQALRTDLMIGTEPRFHENPACHERIVVVVSI